MKKSLLNITLFLACAVVTHAQTLYFVTSNGGSGNFGTINSFTPATNTFNVENNFLGFNGHNPTGTPVLASNGKLYGVTITGGSGNSGTIYSFDPVTRVFTTLANLSGNPKGSLIQAKNGLLYGTTEFGGNGNGTVFSYAIGATAVTTVYTFLGRNVNTALWDGSRPTGSLFEATNGKLYGMTSWGGRGDDGIVFSVDPATSALVKVKDFNWSDGAQAYGSFIQLANGKLYAMTNKGGAGAGCIFSFDPGTSTFVTLVNSNSEIGFGAYGSLAKATNGKLYGITYYGGSSGEGVIFEYDPVTYLIKKRKDLSAADGKFPYGQLYQASNGKLYGLTSAGGSNDLGVVFSFDPVTFAYTKLLDFNGSNGAFPYWGGGFVDLIQRTPPKHVKYFRDSDGDGYGDLYAFVCSDTVPAGYVTNNYDCDDHKRVSDPNLERVRMCNHGVAVCVNAIDINAKLALGWTLALCPTTAARSAGGVLTDAGETQELPTKYRLSNYPNPFAGRSTIKYELPFDSRVSIKVYDLLGRTVTTLVNENKKAGVYTVDFDAGLNKGSLYYRIVAKSGSQQFEQTNKMIQLR